MNAIYEKKEIISHIVEIFPQMSKKSPTNVKTAKKNKFLYI